MYVDDDFADDPWYFSQQLNKFVLFDDGLRFP